LRSRAMAGMPWLSGPMPVIEWRLSGMPRSWAAAQNTSYRGSLYGRSAGGDAQIIAPLSPTDRHRDSSRTASSTSYRDTIASPASRLGAHAQYSASQPLY